MKIIIAFVLICVALLAHLYSVEATYGFDLSYFQGAVSVNAFQCLKNSGYNFGILEGTAGNSGSVNPHLGTILHNAHAAGIPYVDVYVFLNFHKGNPKGQVQEVINIIKSSGVNFNGMIWHDIEGSQYWGSCAANQQFLREAVQQVAGSGIKQGIYSSASQWGPIMCGATEFSNLPLWYAHYDGTPSFSDFRPFGGWSKPAIKQFQGTTNLCGTSIDKDFY